MNKKKKILNLIISIMTVVLVMIFSHFDTSDLGWDWSPFYILFLIIYVVKTISISRKKNQDKYYDLSKYYKYNMYIFIVIFLMDVSFLIINYINYGVIGQALNATIVSTLDLSFLILICYILLIIYLCSLKKKSDQKISFKQKILNKFKRHKKIKQ